MPKPMINRTPGTDLEPVTFAAEQLSPIRQAALLGNDSTLWNSYRFTSTSWQREAWRFYHCIPELHFAANYVGAACSRVRLFIEGVDKYNRPTGEVDDDDQIAALGQTMFGTQHQQAEALNAIGVNLTVAGECYVVGRSPRQFDPDKWYVVSTSSLKRRNGQYAVNLGYGPEELLATSDLLVRLWSPDREYIVRPDSPTQACLNVLAELEELMLFEFSQIDSRLAGGGIVWLPAEMSNGPSDASTAPQSADDVFNQMALAAKAARSGRGTAAGVVSQFIEIPGEYIGKMQDKPMRFDSDAVGQAEGVQGRGAQPPGDRHEHARRDPSRHGRRQPHLGLVDRGKLRQDSHRADDGPHRRRPHQGIPAPLLKAMGKDPLRYQVSFDTAPLTVRASRLQDTLNLYEKGLVKADTVLLAGNYNVLTDTLTEEESTERFVRELMLRDPTLIAVPPPGGGSQPRHRHARASVLAVPGDPNAPGPPPPPAPARSVDNQRRPVDPRSTDTGPTRPATNQGTPILASAVLDDSGEAVLRVAYVVARRALEIAGGRLLTRQVRGQFPDVPKFEIHTRIKVTPGQAREALAGAFDHLVLDFAGLGVDTDDMIDRLTTYCVDRMISGKPQDMDRLAMYVSA